jgi:hypothetical protein
MEDELRLEVDCKDGFTFAGDPWLTVGYWPVRCICTCRSLLAHRMWHSNT